MSRVSSSSTATGTTAVTRERFAELLKENDPQLRRLAWRLLGSRSAMDDALQDAYTKAFRKLGSFVGSEPQFAGWLYRITYNTCIDHLRRRKRRTAEIHLDDHEWPSDRRVSVGDQTVQRAEIKRALGLLTPDHLAAFTLVDGEGFTYDEAAEILKVARGTVASRVNRARAAMRRELGVTPTEDVR